MSGYDKRGERMTKEERLEWLKCIEKDIYVSSLESTFADDSKSCAIHSIIEELEQEPTTKNDLGVDCISRAQTQTEIEMNAYRYTLAKERGGIGQVEWSDHLIKVSDAVDIIRKLPPVTPQEPRWIPVSERLPEADEYVGDVAKYYLVQNEYEDMLVARYTHSEYWEQMYQLKPISDEIVAWRELPKLYKAESEIKE